MCFVLSTPWVLCAVGFLIIEMVPAQLSTNTVAKDDCLCQLAGVHSWSAPVDAKFAVEDWKQLFPVSPLRSSICGLLPGHIRLVTFKCTRSLT